MSAAVSGADGEAYLSCVSLADPCFATEQRNWAKDLKRAAPERFEFTLDGEDPALASDGAAEAKVRMSWRMPEGRDRSLAYTARFVRADAGWLYAGERWQKVEADRIRVFYEGDLEPVARRVAEVLPAVRAHVQEEFQLEGDADLAERTQEIKLYRSMRHLQQSIYLSYKNSLSGWNEPGESIKILAQAETGKGALRPLLGHEYGHVATFQLGPKATDMPWWVLEGVAELASDESGRGWDGVDRMVRRWAADDELVEWERLADFHGEATQHTSHVYHQGHHMIGYITREFGREKRNTWLREMAGGRLIDDATRDVLGMSFADLDARWRRGLVEKREPEAPPAK
jgi:hypothetical protein